MFSISIPLKAARSMIVRFNKASAVSNCMRASGVRTCVLTNSLSGDCPRDTWNELFDVVVVAADVGMRKPEEQIFLHAAAKLGLPPTQCVFIDDIKANVDAATALGMAGVHHRDPLSTAARLAGLLNLPLS